MSSNAPALTPAPHERQNSRYAIVETPVVRSRQLLRAAAPTLRAILPVPDDEVPARVRMLIALLIAALPWVILGIWAPSGWAGDVALLVFTVLIGATYFGHAVACAWPQLQGPNARRQPPVVLLQVLSATSYAQGWFALLYYIVSTDSSAQAFDPPLGRIDAAYFTIGTATTTGTADIHPVGGFTRLVVCVQMVLSLFLVVTAAGIAFQRLFGPRFLKTTPSVVDQQAAGRGGGDAAAPPAPPGPAPLAVETAEDRAAPSPVLAAMSYLPG
jgi:Ion channel